MKYNDLSNILNVKMEDGDELWSFKKVLNQGKNKRKWEILVTGVTVTQVGGHSPKSEFEALSPLPNMHETMICYKKTDESG